jgi:hypothetical protein
MDQITRQKINKEIEDSNMINQLGKNKHSSQVQIEYFPRYVLDHKTAVNFKRLKSYKSTLDLSEIERTEIKNQ